MPRVSVCLQATEFADIVVRDGATVGVADVILRPSTERVFGDASGPSDQRATVLPR